MTDDMIKKPKRAYSQAQNKATQKYMKEHYERIHIAVPKGQKDLIKAAADAAGESLTAYVMKAVEMRMNNEQ